MLERKWALKHCVIGSPCAIHLAMICFQPFLGNCITKADWSLTNLACLPVFVDIFSSLQMILAVTYFLCSVYRTMVRIRKGKDDEAVLPAKCDVCNLMHTPGAQCPTTTQAQAVQEEDQEGNVIQKQNEPIPAEIPAPEESAATTGARGKYLADFFNCGLQILS